MGAKPTQSAPLKEALCNKAAAEFLVPLDILSIELDREEPLSDAVSRPARTLDVITLVVLRRLLDAEWIDRAVFESHWNDEIARFRTSERNNGGRDFYGLAIARAGRRFVRALAVSTLEGQAPYRDAFRILGIKRVETLKELGRKAGVGI